LNHGNKASYVKVSVDNLFHIGTVLSVPYIYLDDGYIRFRQDLDNSRLGHEYYIVEDVIGLENAFNFIRQNSYV